MSSPMHMNTPSQRVAGIHELLGAILGYFQLNPQSYIGHERDQQYINKKQNDIDRRTLRAACQVSRHWTPVAQETLQRVIVIDPYALSSRYMRCLDFARTSGPRQGYRGLGEVTRTMVVAEQSVVSIDLFTCLVERMERLQTGRFGAINHAFDYPFTTILIASTNMTPILTTLHFLEFKEDVFDSEDLLRAGSILCILPDHIKIKMWLTVGHSHCAAEAIKGIRPIDSMTTLEIAPYYPHSGLVLGPEDQPRLQDWVFHMELPQLERLVLSSGDVRVFPNDKDLCAHRESIRSLHINLDNKKESFDWMALSDQLPKLVHLDAPVFFILEQSNFVHLELKQVDIKYMCRFHTTLNCAPYFLVMALNVLLDRVAFPKLEKVEHSCPKDAVPSQSNHCQLDLVMQKLVYSPSLLIVSNQPNADYMKMNSKSATLVKCNGDETSVDSASPVLVLCTIEQSAGRFLTHASPPNFCQYLCLGPTTKDLMPCSLKLGGKSSVFIDVAYNLDIAAAHILFGKLGHLHLHGAMIRPFMTRSRNNPEPTGWGGLKVSNQSRTKNCKWATNERARTNRK
ncbi:hypothetical protein DFH11DRAFT_1552273 [Phellopilus nigrolimitatus]|nr:hypothetical protein DFH11DRAFT_1552273 [Phellopilus nigrolimitatus]